MLLHHFAFYIFWARFIPLIASFAQLRGTICNGKRKTLFVVTSHLILLRLLQNDCRVSYGCTDWWHSWPIEERHYCRTNGPYIQWKRESTNTIRRPLLSHKAPWDERVPTGRQPKELMIRWGGEKHSYGAIDLRLLWALQIWIYILPRGRKYSSSTMRNSTYRLTRYMMK